MTRGDRQDGGFTVPRDAADIRDVRFRATKWGTGYDQGEVDEVLDRVAAALGERAQGGRGAIPASDLDPARLTVTRLREGYSRADVDEYFALLRRRLAH